MTAQDEIIAVRQKRLHATRAAALIGQISRKTGIRTDVPWQVLSELPEWCLGSDRLKLQRLCGVFYLSPLIASSIDGSLLRRIQAFVGVDVFELIRSDRFNHETAGVLNTEHIELQIMAHGSSVLLETLDGESLVRLYTAVIGPPARKMDKDFAIDLFAIAWELTNTGQLTDTKDQSAKAVAKAVAREINREINREVA